MQRNKPNVSKFSLILLAVLVVTGIRSCGGTAPTHAVGGQYAAPQGGGNWSKRASYGGGDLYVGGDGSGAVYYMDSHRSSYSSGN